MSVKTRDVLTRAFKTFWQACIAYVIASITVLQSALSGESTWAKVLITLGVGAVAAGLSAVWNGFVSPLLKKDSTTEKIVDSVPETIKSVLELVGIDLTQVTKSGLEKMAEQVGVILTDEDTKQSIIDKLTEVVISKDGKQESKAEVATK